MRMVPVGSQAMEAKGELSGTVSYKPQSKSQKPKAKSQKPKAKSQKPKAISQRTQDNNKTLCGPSTRSMERWSYDRALLQGFCFSGPDDRLPHGRA
jgi:hypothetical protein